MSPIAMTLVFLFFGGALAYSLTRRWRLLLVGAPEPRFSLDSFSGIRERIDLVLRYALVQEKMPKNERYRLAGLAHIGIFVAFNVLLVNSVLLWVRGYDPSFDFWGLLSRTSPIGWIYSVTKELAAFAAIVGAGYFVYLRVGPKPRRMSFGFEGLLILFIIITMMLADYLYVGGTLAREAHATGENSVAWSWFEPFGSLMGMGVVRTSSGTTAFLQHLGFWYHAVWVLAFANLLPYSKHFHVITVLPNIFAGDTGEPGKLPDVTDIEGKLERGEATGIKMPADLTWKHILDLYTCTECGRCSDNCPAYTTDKQLSPKHLTLALRDHLYDVEPLYIDTGGIERPDTRPKDGEELEVHGRPPDGYRRSLEDVELIGDLIDPAVIWACTTCRACEEQCPVNISYVDKIVGMRRSEYMDKDKYPRDLGKMFNALETNGNPWNLPAMDRGNWASELDFEVPLVGDRPKAEVLYWVGCAANYDDQAKKVARSFASLMHHAGVDFAIMGGDATCTGDPARRAGNELLFQMLAQQNVEALNGHGASNKTVVTACPHCFNTLANEYGAFGGSYQVKHHTEMLRDLIDEGRLEPKQRVSLKVSYHDSCYLGRYNDVYDAPREILEAIPGVTLTEPEYWNRERGLCCGAGGAQMWKEEEEPQHGKEPQRVNNKRTLQLLDTGADAIASACPFCMTMLSDGIKAHEREESVKQLDVAQILERSVDPKKTAPIVAARDED
ncbi:MAG: heterodisulfide reductase-related iron-sulfur binding cluster [Sandaracinaceae bacterium]